MYKSVNLDAVFSSDFFRQCDGVLGTTHFDYFQQWLLCSPDSKGVVCSVPECGWFGKRQDYNSLPRWLTRHHGSLPKSANNGEKSILLP